MPLFEFNDGVDDLNNNGTNISVAFTDDGIDFILSTTGNAGAGNNNNINYNPDDGGSDGVFSITDSSVNAPFTLTVNDTAAPIQENFAADGGNITLNIGGSVSGAWNVTFVNASGGMNQQFVNVSGNQILSFATTSEYSSIVFTPTGAGNFIQVDSLNANIECYLEGTGIATPAGDVAVQDLRPGDVVLTADGGQTTVKWVGEQPVQTRLTHPAKVNPICLSAGSIAPNVPMQDLFVSPDHAIAIDGILYNASALVNGQSIYMVAQMPLNGFTYYHVETDAHELILAEGCASESYLDSAYRDSNFVNADARAQTPLIPAMDMPRISARRLVPQQVVDQLAMRAEDIAAEQSARTKAA
mmetsp:Transcript_18381/g.29679  ORF Transcript_18381/g.29679 Transcript_18381/m.29679 type:complete len:357 (+) Transcript_18381:226-1296(+)